MLNHRKRRSTGGFSQSTFSTLFVLALLLCWGTEEAQSAENHRCNICGCENCVIQAEPGVILQFTDEHGYIFENMDCQEVQHIVDTTHAVSLEYCTEQLWRQAYTICQCHDPSNLGTTNLETMTTTIEDSSGIPNDNVFGGDGLASPTTRTSTTTFEPTTSPSSATITTGHHGSTASTTVIVKAPMANFHLRVTPAPSSDSEQTNTVEELRVVLASYLTRTFNAYFVNFVRVELLFHSARLPHQQRPQNSNNAVATYYFEGEALFVRSVIASTHKSLRPSTTANGNNQDSTDDNEAKPSALLISQVLQEEKNALQLAAVQSAVHQASLPALDGAQAASSSSFLTGLNVVEVRVDDGHYNNTFQSNSQKSDNPHQSGTINQTQTRSTAPTAAPHTANRPAAPTLKKIEPEPPLAISTNTTHSGDEKYGVGHAWYRIPVIVTGTVVLAAAFTFVLVFCCKYFQYPIVCFCPTRRHVEDSKSTSNFSSKGATEVQINRQRRRLLQQLSRGSSSRRIITRENTFRRHPWKDDDDEDDLERVVFADESDLVVESLSAHGDFEMVEGDGLMRAMVRSTDSGSTSSGSVDENEENSSEDEEDGEGDGEDEEEVFEDEGEIVFYTAWKYRKPMNKQNKELGDSLL